MRLLRIACLTCVVLTLGLSFAHVLEIPGKLQFDGAEWLMVQHHLYVGFGTAGAVIEVLAIVLAWALALRLHGKQGSHAALAAAIATSIGLIEWALVVGPMNARLNGWTAATLPPGWTAVRNRWEAGHAVQAVLFFVAFLSWRESRFGCRGCNAKPALLNTHGRRAGYAALSRPTSHVSGSRAAGATATQDR